MRRNEARPCSLERSALLVQKGHMSLAAHAPGSGQSSGFVALARIWLAAASPDEFSTSVSTSIGQMPNSGDPCSGQHRGESALKDAARMTFFSKDAAPDSAASVARIRASSKTPLLTQ